MPRSGPGRSRGTATRAGAFDSGHESPTRSEFAPDGTFSDAGPSQGAISNSIAAGPGVAADGHAEPDSIAAFYYGHASERLDVSSRIAGAGPRQPRPTRLRGHVPRQTAGFREMRSTGSSSRGLLVDVSPVSAARRFCASASRRDTAGMRSHAQLHAPFGRVHHHLPDSDLRSLPAHDRLQTGLRLAESFSATFAIERSGRPLGAQVSRSCLWPGGTFLGFS